MAEVPSSSWYNLRLARYDSPNITPDFFRNYTEYPDYIAVNKYEGDYCNSVMRPNAYNVSLSKPPTPPIGRLEDGVWYWQVASNLDQQATPTFGDSL